ncbi:MAG: hypothetical protein MUE51_01785 [Thermoleophilia bacterium]|jgi:hypothetical protein|nr:hypothetical protein [Thermoleophilia bacterium]
MSDAIPAEITDQLGEIDPVIAERLTEALQSVSADLGPREVAVLQRLLNGLKTGAPPAELNAFVRLLPVTVSRVVQPAIEPAVAS